MNLVDAPPGGTGARGRAEITNTHMEWEWRTKMAKGSSPAGGGGPAAPPKGAGVKQKAASAGTPARGINLPSDRHISVQAFAVGTTDLIRVKIERCKGDPNPLLFEGQNPSAGESGRLGYAALPTEGKLGKGVAVHVEYKQKGKQNWNAPKGYTRHENNKEGYVLIQTTKEDVRVSFTWDQ